MFTSEHTVSLSMPPERAIAFVADVDSWKKWALRVSDVKRERQGVLIVGERFTVVARLWGGKLSTTYRVTELEPAHLVWRTESGASQAVLTFTARPSGTGSELTERVEASLGGLLKLLEPLLKRTSEKQLVKNLAALKAAIES